MLPWKRWFYGNFANSRVVIAPNGTNLSHEHGPKIEYFDWSCRSTNLWSTWDIYKWLLLCLVLRDGIVFCVLGLRSSTTYRPFRPTTSPMPRVRTIRRPTLRTTDIPYGCAEDQYLCKETSKGQDQFQCIGTSSVCDGKPDCPKIDDETDCGVTNSKLTYLNSCFND